jgi:hypothetical protein
MKPRGGRRKKEFDPQPPTKTKHERNTSATPTGTNGISHRMSIETQDEIGIQNLFVGRLLTFKSQSQQIIT